MHNATLTAVPGISVGHAHDAAAITGCTVVLLPPRTTCSVEVRGGAPGTRETDLLAPTATVQHANAICLAGGSAFGLAAATGVVDWLRERGIGYDARGVVVPIVPGAILFDLGIGHADRWPDAAMGYAACEAATPEPVIEGSVGAGMGATVGKIRGMPFAMKGGVGSAAVQLPSGVTIAALAVCNAFGDVWSADGRIIAGARDDRGRFVNTQQALAGEIGQQRFGTLNTTLALVATDATLDKAGCRKLAEMAQDGLARAVRPAHTPVDGDVVFTAATGAYPAEHMMILGAAAAGVLAQSIERCVTTATSLGGVPATRDLPAHGP